MATQGVDYNRDAGEYARHRRVHPGVLAELASIVASNADQAILEIGVGSGNCSRALGEVAGSTVFGIDPSISMLAQARKRGSKHVINGMAERLPFREQCFGCLYSVDVIHHIRDRNLAAREAMRVLVPGGVITIATDSETDLLARVPLTRYFPETVTYERTRYPDSATIESELRQAGFVNLEQRCVEHRYPLTDIQPYQDKAFSSLHGITDDAFARGIARLEDDLRGGHIEAVSLYTLFVGYKPVADA